MNQLSGKQTQPKKETKSKESSANKDKNTKEQEEKDYLKNLKDKVRIALADIDGSIHQKKTEIDEMNHHMEEYKRDMDHLEKNALRETIFNYNLIGNHHLDKRKRLKRLLDVPYFGRIDFKEENSPKSEKIYVGVHNFQDEQNGSPLVYDWRAPVSGMFYDYELGEASYETKDKIISGNISLKRQFRIRQGEMDYMLDSDVTIQDDVLQKELNRSSDGKMKNIVATIQREQNAIIRDEETTNLIIQGVAGSGKTSVALHRIAYLLYKFKDTISSDDILIISPNKVFSSYISNVLPELGEETIVETGMEEIANELFDYQIKFEGFFDQISALVSNKNENQIERILFKSSSDLLKKMDDYLLHLENNGFNPTDLILKGKPVPAWFIRDSFIKHSRLPMLNRFNEVVRDIVNNVAVYYGHEIMGKERTQLHTTVRKMFPSVNLRVLYKGFYEWMGKPELLKTKKGSVYEYNDVYPLLYLKLKLEGLKPFSKIKHLVIDEMQDYSPIQYRILRQLFNCKKTILGDINQSVNPFSGFSLSNLSTVFPDTRLISMYKSYRSTYEITQFSKKISEKSEAEPIERHGEEPQISVFRKKEEEISHILKLISNFRNGEHNSLGIICKTQSQADNLYEELEKKYDGINDIIMTNSRSVSFGSGIVITTAYLAKGLEFDSVIVPFCTDKNYETKTDRQMLYVACTRAMHKLSLTSTGVISNFVE